MKLYLDQMLHADVTRALRAAGHDVVRAGEVGQARADDEEILERAGQEGRVVVTLDKDFGDWAVLPLRLHGGVIRVKAHPALTGNDLAVLVPFLERHRQEEFQNRLVIVSRNSERWIDTAPGN
jgi:predicted nuclease of predicted toxin-antitoxin system